ncbi:MAG: transposase [Myxococcales bacterium]|nr:transposase [Myxococcales bacterium]
MSLTARTMSSTSASSRSRTRANQARDGVRDLSIVFVGYRFPPTDAQARSELLGAIMKNVQRHIDLHIVLGPTRNDVHALKGGDPEQLKLQIADLEQQLAKRNHLLFGDKSEKRGQGDKPEGQKPVQTGHGPRAQSLLPEVEQVHLLDEADKVCTKCGGQLETWDGQFEESEEVDVVELKYVLKKHRRQKYRCGCGACIETAPGPLKLFPGARYSVAFAINVAIAKYADHLPLERQVKMAARQGLESDSQTLWDQINALAKVLGPTYTALCAYVLSQPSCGAEHSRASVVQLHTAKPFAFHLLPARPYFRARACSADDMASRSRRTYDHRIKEQILHAGNPELFPELEIPRSTAQSWIRRGVGDVVSLEAEHEVEAALRARVLGLEHRTAMLIAVLRLVLALLRVSGFTLERGRVADERGKRLLLGAVEGARKILPLSAALRVLRLSPARYHAGSGRAGLHPRRTCCPATGGAQAAAGAQSSAGVRPVLSATRGGRCRMKRTPLSSRNSAECNCTVPAPECLAPQLRAAARRRQPCTRACARTCDAARGRCRAPQPGRTGFTRRSRSRVLAPRGLLGSSRQKSPQRTPLSRYL